MTDDMSKPGQLLQKKSAFFKVEFQNVLTAPHKHLTQITVEISTVSPVTRKSSKYIITPGNSPNSSDMTCKYTSGAIFKPNGKRRKRNLPFGVAIVHKFEAHSVREI